MIISIEIEGYKWLAARAVPKQIRDRLAMSCKVRKGTFRRPFSAPASSALDHFDTSRFVASYFGAKNEMNADTVTVESIKIYKSCAGSNKFSKLTKFKTSFDDGPPKFSNFQSKIKPFSEENVSSEENILNKLGNLN
uniref:Uncharacterized protein n=1 Tax=Romanomermis culicivorax TaxID=13658 RepID=A0A915L3Z2_ROMCU